MELRGQAASADVVATQRIAIRLQDEWAIAAVEKRPQFGARRGEVGGYRAIGISGSHTRLREGMLPIREDYLEHALAVDEQKVLQTQVAVGNRSFPSFVLAKGSEDADDGRGCQHR
ncbi:hypothetical protein PlfCFBP13513_08605 [Plantibacter flavus]|nr:hypothetical protein PlfCFBP13513_08605 [Plantibacter flavus]